MNQATPQETIQQTMPAAGHDDLAPRADNGPATSAFFDAAFLKRSWWILLALAAAGAVVYARALHGTFVNYDDLEYVVENPHVTGGLTWENVRWAFGTDYFSNWHPLTWLSHMLDVQLFGLKAAGHHFTGIALHIANSLLLFAVLTAATGAFWRSAVVAAIWVVHPINVESVAWIAERKTVLSAFFGLLSVWSYLRYTRSRNRWSYLAALAFFALGLMAKPMIVTLPLLLLLLDIWPLNRFAVHDGAGGPGSLKRQQSAGRLVAEKLPLLALSLGSSIATMIVQKNGGSVLTLTSMPLGDRVANALVSYVLYLGKIFWPLRLAIFYPHREIPAAAAAGSALTLIGITGLALAAVRTKPYILVGWLWFAGSLFPMIGIVQAGEQAMADRYAYLPMIGIAVAVVWGMADLFSKFPALKLAPPAAAGLVTALLAILAQIQVQYWNNSLSLWSHALAITSNNHVAHANLGTALAVRGRDLDAIDELNRAIAIVPNFPEAHNSLGALLARNGRIEEASSHFDLAVRSNPKLTKARNNLARSYADRGRIDDAVREYKEVLRTDPNDRTAIASLKELGAAAAQGAANR